MEETDDGILSEIYRDGDRLAVDIDIGDSVVQLCMTVQGARQLAAELIDAAKALDADLRGERAVLCWPVANGED